MHSVWKPNRPAEGMIIMTRILLAHSNHLYSDAKQIAKMQPYPPLQTLLAAAVLQQHGHTVQVFDPTLMPASAPELVAAFAQTIGTFQPHLIAIVEDGFNYLTKMCLTRHRDLAFLFAQAAQRAGIPCVAHGPGAGDAASLYLQAGFSAVLLGEMEDTLVELANSASWSDVAGLVYGHDGRLAYSAPRPFRPHLDTLPRAAWELVDLDPYRRAWQEHHGYLSLNLVTSRGCPYHCNWCAKPVFQQHYAVRDAALVAAEIQHLVTHYQPGHLWFADDIFALSPRWARAFADAMRERNLRVPFKMQSRCDLMTRDTVASLASAGCSEVWMGAESGSQRILDAMEKGGRVDDVFLACDNLWRHGIRPCLFLQFGYPGEQWDDIEATLAMVRRAAPADVGISVSYPLPGTKFHRIVSEQLGAKRHWAESGDLSMMFSGAYSTAFYQALAAAIHLDVRRDPAADSAWQQVHRLREPLEQPA